MKPRQHVSQSLLRLAALQAGVVTYEQAVGSGLGRHSIQRLLQSASWRRIARGCYLTVPMEPPWNALAWGGVLLGGPGARMGPESSAFLHHLTETAPARPDVLVPWARPREISGPWRFVRERDGARASRSVGDPPRLGVESTVLDLASSRDEPAVVGLVTTAVQRRLTTVDRLRTELGNRTRHPHRRLLHNLLADVADGVESPIELRYLRDVERAHGLPRAARQRRSLRHRSDVDYGEYLVLVELDGRAGHEGTGRFRDMRRDNRFALVLGQLTLRYGWHDLTVSPCAVAFEVFSALELRGFGGAFRRCARCARASEGDLAAG